MWEILIIIIEYIDHPIHIIYRNSRHFHNIVFDIVYTERDRNTLAMKLYREFKNLGLMISDRVKVECMKVIMKYSMEFARDFNNFLAITNSRGKSWDKVDPDISKTKFLTIKEKPG